MILLELAKSCARWGILFPEFSPSAVYMRWLTGSPLVQIMACRLFGAKPLPEPSSRTVNWTPGNKLQGNSNQNTKLFVHENAFETILCEMATILFRERWDKLIVSFPITYILITSIIQEVASVTISVIIQHHTNIFRIRVLVGYFDLVVLSWVWEGAYDLWAGQIDRSGHCHCRTHRPSSCSYLWLQKHRHTTMRDNCYAFLRFQSLIYVKLFYLFLLSCCIQYDDILDRVIE